MDQNIVLTCSVQVGRKAFSQVAVNAAQPNTLESPLGNRQGRRLSVAADIQCPQSRGDADERRPRRAEHRVKTCPEASVSSRPAHSAAEVAARSTPDSGAPADPVQVRSLAVPGPARGVGEHPRSGQAVSSGGIRSPISD